jgi:hypothetical protein
VTGFLTRLRIATAWAGGRPRLISDEGIEAIVAAAGTRPEKLGLPFTRWSLRKLAAYLASCAHPVAIGRERLDETQARGYRAWKRHAALALAAYALLAIASALAKAAHPEPVLPDDPGQQAPADCGMTALTVPEIQRLLTMGSARRIPLNQNTEFHLAWSDWRRRHQARARARWHHYRARLALAA